ncbi:MAG: tRNA threonylcarbamoyladenosine dehydratase [Bacteroidetes bacterium ADurb.Bin408]|nr:MAG: tRNA threonylcarbamoyladenosine dehydratase [Bacteroidetes bacterium ADurb.Bin408]
MENWQSRTELLLGSEGLERLKTSHVMIAGLGGVGSWAAEFVCRAGVGKISIIDHDVVKPSNRNRQLPALLSTEGQKKTDVMAQRLRDINPQIILNTSDIFLRDDATKELILKLNPDFIIDAIDTLSPKVFLIHFAVTNNFKIVSSMGAGGRIDPTQIEIADISKSKNCRLAYFIRKRLRKLGVCKGFDVVFSRELADEDAIVSVKDESNKKSTVGTISYLPAVFGAFCASVALRHLTANDIKKTTPV